MNTAPIPDVRPFVLLVDDDKFLLEAFAMKFEKKGYRVHAVMNAAEALDVVRKTEPNAFVLVLDLLMPGMDGFTLLETMQREKIAKNVLKMVISNQSSEADKKRAAELGADMFLVKAETTPEEVVNKITDELARRFKR